jgi:hypothetical protein
VPILETDAPDGFRHVIGVDKVNDEIVIFRITGGVQKDGTRFYHGNVQKWKDLDQKHKNALYDAGKVGRKGNILY